MKPYEQWQQMVETERQQAEHEAFWNAYFEKETEAYRAILTENTGKLSGTHAELADRFNMTVAEFAGFIDGINTSLKKEVNLEKLGVDSAVKMEIDFENAATGQADPFVVMMDWCERSMSKAILGGTLTSQADGKSSTNALGNVHNEVRLEVRDSDLKQLAATLTRDLIYPLYALNGKSYQNQRRIPRLEFDVTEPEDMAQVAVAVRRANLGTDHPVRGVAQLGHMRRLEAAGIEVVRIAGSELGSGRGGPRCMSCPVEREDI